MVRRVSIAIDDESLYAALKEQAAKQGVSIKSLVQSALNDWLDTQEEIQDISDADDAMKEGQKEGTIEAREFFHQLRSDS